MTMVLRHLLSIFLLPFMVVVAGPYWLLMAFATSDHRWSEGAALVWLSRSVGMVVFLVGFALFAWCISLFARVGRGTLAPWDPTRNLVAVGPYRHVRNPMITGVVFMLFGEALFGESALVGLWTCAFVAINHVYFVLSEERGMEKRFGESYRAYKAKVPRWIPRWRPWPGE
jgi:protein-S-isoprenylcysteine O-methyltransferase Ste14